ncbi:hypothetical protein [Halalkalicoccus sp. NIPERK01]|uniref:hypothetical protein n=1 Tax=Halalkalicoccus sp. NIPERK01 TaxID=3053469 RepID=UPI00256EDB08|nr:hypothetical protein [Halalkalicoccus sp. NIPERK01]MDL5362256.1 hypothetical protein [Halalkalicoccus sp. NIPERK01]
MQIAGLDLAFRLAVAVFVIVTPTLMFLGLVRLLERMRDEDLIYRLMTEEELRNVERSHSLAGFVEEVTGTTPGTIRCSDCGTINAAGMDSCFDCGERIG